MKLLYENSYRISPQNPCVINYEKCQSYAGMPVMHYHPYYEIYFLISGKRKYFFQNKIFNLIKGDVIIIKPNEAHKAIAYDNSQFDEYERYLINMDEELFLSIIKSNKSLAALLKKEIISVKPQILNEMIDILKKVERETSFHDEIYCSSVKNHLERIFINLYLNDSYDTVNRHVLKNDMRLNDAIEYIAANYNKRITLKECADICYMSESYFTKIFHRIIGIGFKNYLNAIRVQKACEYLTGSDLSISEISESVGFDSSSYFGTVFKNTMGVSPKEYRKEKQY